jgi:glycine cleavage system aminomethyltransferase T
MSIFGENVLVNRMNRTQAAIWHLMANGQSMPEQTAYTDIRENTLCLAVIGPGSLAVSEKVTNLDLADPGRRTPCLIQGPLAHVPCQIVILGTEQGNQGFVLTCSRGYARDVVHTLLLAGEEFGLRPAGERRMVECLEI